MPLGVCVLMAAAKIGPVRRTTMNVFLENQGEILKKEEYIL